MIGRGFEARRAHRLDDAPESATGHEWRRALYRGDAVWGQVSGEAPIERGRVELAQGVVPGVGEIDDDEVVPARVVLEPDKRVGVDDLHPGRPQCVVVEGRERVVIREDLRHRRIQVDQRDALDPLVLEDLSNRHAVPAAEHEDLPRRGHRRQSRMDQRLVVAVLVEGGKLQVAVQEQPQLALRVGHHDALIPGSAGEDHRVLIQALLGELRQHLGEGHARQEQHEDGVGLDGEQGAPVLRAKQVTCPDRYQHVQDAKDKRRPHQPNLGDEPQGKQQRRGQRTHVVERQDLRDQVAKRELVLEDAHHKRDLQPYQYPGAGDPRVEHHPERVELGKGQEEDQGGSPADEANQDLNLDEARDQIFPEVAGQVGAYPHREQVDADDGGELGDTVAEHVAGNGPGQKLVDQSTGGNGEDREEQGLGLGTVVLRNGFLLIHGC